MSYMRDHPKRPGISVSMLMSGILLTTSMLYHTAYANDPVEKTARVVKSLANPYPHWRNLTAEQQRILQPLKNEWPQLTEIKQRKWVEIATRYPSMSTAEQQRIQQRMVELVQLPAEQRRALRDTFREVKTLPTDDKQAKWAKYQQLSDEQKAQLRASGTTN